MPAFLGGAEGFLDYMAAALNSASPEESLNDPNCEREVFLPLERPSLPPFLSPLPHKFYSCFNNIALGQSRRFTRPPKSNCADITLETEGSSGRAACTRINAGPATMCDCCFYCSGGFLTSVAPAKLAALSSRCADLNECKEFGSSVCDGRQCENTVGSYRCFTGCQPGLQGEDATDCGKPPEPRAVCCCVSMTPGTAQQPKYCNTKLVMEDI